ncbi:hypothetical protein [Canibacter oris]|uniref:Phage tail protein n=1 Tax=Canibacter oris TaxID=1365628 RepID=A0A840DDV6_9MICO|nr:hypothetical protein [Canibacter oris]MBB4071631.1 hypothetical protein [Canibacter oris]
MWQKLTGARRPAWQFTLLDSLGQPVRELTTVKGGSIEVAAQSRLCVTGNLTLVDPQDINWLKHRVRVTYDPGVPGVDSWPVATMLFTSPKQTVTETGSSYEVALLSLLAILDEDTVETTYSLPADTNIINTVRALVAETGEPVDATPSDLALRNPLVWDAGTPKLTIINELLAAAGYWALHVNGAGVFQITPYTSPQHRQPVFTFKPGAAAIHTPEYEREQNLTAVPNKYLVVSDGNDQTPAIVGIAENQDPASPYSYQNRGRWITAVETTEVASQDAANQLAQRRLLARMTPTAKITASHAILPLNPNDAIGFETGGKTIKATIRSLTYGLTYDSLCEAEWRETPDVNLG